MCMYMYTGLEISPPVPQPEQQPDCFEAFDDLPEIAVAVDHEMVDAV